MLSADFDALARFIAGLSTRRAMLQLASLGLAAATGETVLPELADAKKKRKKKKRCLPVGASCKKKKKRKGKKKKGKKRKCCPGTVCSAVGGKRVCLQNGCQAPLVDCDGVCQECCDDAGCVGGTCEDGICVCPGELRNCEGTCQECCTDAHCTGGDICQAGECVACLSYPFELKWGGHGTGNGKFNNLRGIAVDGSGDVFVVDSSDDRVQKFNSNGDFILKWGSPSPSNSYDSPNDTFSSPLDVAVDREGNVYVADSQNVRISKFSSTGQFIGKIKVLNVNESGGESPMALAVDSMGNIYVSCGLGHFVRRIGTDGSDAIIAQNGDDDGEVNGAVSIAIDSEDSVYVLDRQWKFGAPPPRVLRFDSEGSFLGQENLAGDAYTFLSIAIDRVDNIYLSKPPEIVKLTNGFVPLTAFAAANVVYGLDLAPDGSVYAGDTIQDEVQKFVPVCS